MAKKKSPLSILLEITQALSSLEDLRAALHRVLEVLERDKGAEQAMVTVVDEVTGATSIVASLGVPIAEGIAGKVLSLGKPIIERRLVSVPIAVGRRVAGALTVTLTEEEELEFLTIVASMIAQSVASGHRLEAERQHLLEENNIIGTAGAMRDVYEQISKVARTNTTVLIRGESGTGKELIAQAIHYNSTRAKKPFVKVSCAALPSTLIESELFGYERGAFTGAEARRKGRFEAAEGGTLFLDEIGDIDLTTQVKLLRALQEREFERLGGTQTVKVNVRLVAATNKDLEAALVDRTFREDLYYRLNVFAIFLPPLRERKSDITLLADHFSMKYAAQHGKSIRRISTPAIDMLNSYHWPGNVRELENIIERAVLVADGPVIHGHHLPPSLQTAEASGTVTQSSLKDAVEQFEKDMLVDALKSTRGNRAQAARLLGTTERILGYKVEKYEVDCARFVGEGPKKRTKKTTG